MIVAIGGRSFVVADLDRISFQQSHYLMRHIRADGLEAVWPVDGESDEEYGARVRSGIIRAGNVPEVLGGYLVPEGEQWSEARARETARHLAGVTAPEDHAAILQLAEQVAPDFFVRALDWFAISRVSSPPGLRQPRSPTSVH